MQKNAVRDNLKENPVGHLVVKGVCMLKKKRNLIFAVLEQLLPVLLALICILVVAINTHQSQLAVPLPLQFDGTYSFDGGQTWQALTDSCDLSTDQGDLLLRGHFKDEIFPGGILYLYRDHFAITITKNSELYYMSLQAEILALGEAGKPYLADNCGSEWTLIEIGNGLLQTDDIEIRLQKMHDYIDPDAYRNFLNSCYIGPIDTMIVESYLRPHAAAGEAFGILLLILTVMVLGATVAAIIFQTGMVRNLSKLGMLVFFFGGYLLLDTVTLSFSSEALAFNTYAKQICLMYSAYWVGLFLRDSLTGLRRKLANIVLALSFGLNAALIIPSFLGVWPIYDTLPVWLIGQAVISLVFLGTTIWELIQGANKKYLRLISGILLPITFLLDIAGVGGSMYSHGTCTKIAFAVLLIFYGSRVLKRILVADRKAMKLEKELEESRIAIMLSQIQPHFVYNILNVIYYMCGKDPSVAQMAISKFSDHLRNKLEALHQTELITFRKELDHIHTYLELEQIRFGEELSVVYDIEEDGFLLPVLSVQPLVENAVKHGLAKKRGGGVVTVSTRQTDKAYQITVADNGVGFDVERYMDDGKIHVGLANIRQRLAIRMHASVDINSVPGNGTTVTITIPKEKVT